MNPADDLCPTWTPPGCVYDRQVESMRELRQYAGEGLSGRHMLGERMTALALSNSLSHHDMARASGLAEAEVERIIRERWEHHLYCNTRAAAERVARHMAAA